MKFGHKTRKTLFYRPEFPTTWNLDMLVSWLDRLNMPLNLDTDLKSKLCWPYYRNCWRVTTKHDQGTDWNLFNSFIVDGTAYKFGPYVLSFYSRWILTNFQNLGQKCATPWPLGVALDTFARYTISKSPQLAQPMHVWASPEWALDDWEEGVWEKRVNNR